MPQDDDTATDDLLSDVIQQGIHHEQPPIKEFKPWHRPRKQWIREQQWREGILGLIDSLPLTDRPFTYLSLPGDDLLDVRVIYDACYLEKVRLRFLGFNSLGNNQAAQTELSISLSEVTSLPLIDETSTVVLDKLESIVNRNSRGYSRVRQFGTIDALNIDLCDSIAAPRHWRRGQGGGDTYFDTLLVLLQHQVLNRTAPWLLFLTSRCNPVNVGAEYAERLYGCIKGNLGNPEFCIVMAEILNLDAFDESVLATFQAESTFPTFMQMFCIGFGKWLLQTMIASSPPSAVTMLSSYHYQVTDPGDMVSVAFRFDPIIQLPRDRAGLTRVGTTVAQKVPVSEVELAIKIVQQTQLLTDVDQLLGAHPEDMERMIASTEVLLRNARYPVESYRGWLYPTVEPQ